MKKILIVGNSLAVTKTIEDISQGKMSTVIEEKERNDEIGNLARAFERTIVSLKLAMKMSIPALKKDQEIETNANIKIETIRRKSKK